jgi:cytoskeletal protein CcmA (bactofilin family)
LDGPPASNNILFVSAGTTTAGSNSVFQGSILSGAAITLVARSEVTGDIEAKAAITVGADSVLGGSILAGAVITRGAATRVTGGIFC